jgi:glycosyltransferase involved in cell wall biosynthesis
MLSIAIPLYNKKPFIEKTIKSCAIACSLYAIEHEIIITNNASTDATPDELDTIASMYQNCRIIHLSHTISLPDNWLFALNSCKGTYLKLLLADDLMPAYDVNKAIELIKNSNADYIIGKTQPVFEAKDFKTNYFESVNIFRKQIHPALSAREKVAIISEQIACSSNPFGDIGALIFHRNCLRSLNLGVRVGLPAFTTFPDLDIYLTLYANHCGTYLDETISIFVYNDTSPAVRRNNNSESKTHGLYPEYEAITPLYFLTAIKLKALSEQLSQEEKRFLLNRINEHTRHLLEYSNVSQAKLNQESQTPHHSPCSWPSRDFIRRFARSLYRKLNSIILKMSKTPFQKAVEYNKR